MKKIFRLVTCVLLSQYTYAQNRNTITTAVPFLLINPNGQSMGIGDIGVVAANDYYESGLTQNPALLSRNEKVMGAKFSYKPWLRQLVPDLNIIDGGLYYAVNKKITIGYSYNYFSMGTMDLVDKNANLIATIKPREFYHNLRYAQSLTPNLSIGLGMKYIASDLTNNYPLNGEPTHVGKAIAGDIGVDYRKEFAKKETSYWRYDIGASILNMGDKIGYTDTAHGDFLPMQLSLGTLWTFTKNVSEKNRYSIDLAYQCEKLLVPTPPLYSVTDSMGIIHNMQGNPSDVSVLSGALHSFNDAPDGGREEFAEIIHKVGMENRFTFNQKAAVALRLGLLNESKRKGDRRYFNVGFGARYKFIYLDLAMILLYRERGFHGEEFYSSGIKSPYSYNATIGFKYTFKDKVVAKEKES